MAKHTFVSGQVLTAQQLNENFGEIPKMQHGTRDCSIPSGDNHVVGLLVTFPVPFAAPPTVVANLSHAPSGSARLTARAYSVTSTSFYVALYTGDGSTVTESVTIPVAWVALGR